MQFFRDFLVKTQIFRSFFGKTLVLTYIKLVISVKIHLKTSHFKLGHLGHGVAGLQVVQLLQAPVQLVQRLAGQLAARLALLLHIAPRRRRRPRVGVANFAHRRPRPSSGHRRFFHRSAKKCSILDIVIS